MAAVKMKPIKGYKGKYSVTRDGRVWSHPLIWKPYNTWAGKIITIIRSGKWLKPTITIHGYARVNLAKNKTSTLFTVHRLVANAYIKKIIGKNAINHKNNIKTDNRASNLEWVTTKENIRKAMRDGIFYIHPWKIPISDYKLILKRTKNGESARQIAITYNCTKSTVIRYLKILKERNKWKQ